MRNVFTVFAQDMRHARQGVITLIIAIGLVIVPSFYAWFNIYGSWNPYDNTSGLKVAVANADKGYQGDLLPASVNVGDQVVNSLRANDDLDWTFVKPEQARAGVRSGEYYAAIVIPKSFSADLFTLFSEDAKHAEILYYSNPKENPIAPTITSQGASTVREQINEMFTSTIAKVAIGSIESVTSYLGQGQGSGQIAALSANLRHEAGNLTQAGDLAAGYATLARSASSMTGTAMTAMADAKTSLAERKDTAKDLSGKLDEASDALDQAGAGIDTGLDSLADAFDAVGENAADVAGKPTAAADDVASELRGISTDKVQPMIKELTSYRDVLTALRDQASTEASAHALDLAIKDVNRTIAKLEAHDKKLNDAADKITADAQQASDLAGGIASSAANSAQSIRDLKKSYQDNVAGSLDGLGESVKASGRDTKNLLNSAQGLLADVAGSGAGSADGGSAQGAGDAVASINELADNLDTMHGTLDQQSGKLTQLADTIDEALASGGVDSVRQLFAQPTDSLVTALTAPVTINRKAVFPVANNGSAMTPFYTLMAVWVGIMFLGLILTPQVSDRMRASIPDIKGWQCYLGRGMTFAAFALAQATLLGLGDLLYLRVQAVNPFLFMLCLWWTALVCSAFIYTLAAVFGNIGKAVNTALMIAQIAGVGGTFPVQMLSKGFREVYPYLPFSHAITALRETIGGFYGTVYWEQMGRMGIYLVVALLIGIPLYTPISRLMNRTNELVASTGVMG